MPEPPTWLGNQATCIECSRGLHLIHTGLGQLDLAPGHLAFGLGNLAQFERFAQPRFAFDELGRQWSRRFFLALFEGINVASAK